MNRDFKIVDDDKVSELTRLLIALEELEIIVKFPCWLLPVMDYYRMVRNSVAHNERDKKACEKAFSKVDKDAINADYSIFKGKVPNAVNAITMDDFYFYSACIKHVANYLRMALKGRVDWGHLGYTHLDLDPANIEKGTDSVKLVGRVYLQYCHKGTKEEIRSVLDTLKRRKEEYRISMYNAKKNK